MRIEPAMFTQRIMDKHVEKKSIDPHYPGESIYPLVLAIAAGLDFFTSPIALLATWIRAVDQHIFKEPQKSAT